MLSAATIDPFWACLPYPFERRFTVGKFAAMQTIRMARGYFGRELLPVFCYLVGDTLVDTGLACYGDELAELVRTSGAHRAVITHHHEDHAGNAARLQNEGLEVLSSAGTAALVCQDMPIHLYQHIVWGKMPPAQTAIFGERIRIGPYLADVIPAPGHCPDQVVFHVPEEGWLFSGDAFLSERVQLFRRDEDFAATVATLERLLRLDFDALLCAHRPRFTGGWSSLAAKLQWLRDIEGEVRRYHARGLPTRDIAKRVLRPPQLRMLITAYDASAENMVRSILFGPTPRPWPLPGAAPARPSAG